MDRGGAVVDAGESRYEAALRELGASLKDLKLTCDAPSYEQIRLRGTRLLGTSSSLSKASMSEVFAGRRAPSSRSRLLWLVRTLLSYDDGDEVEPPDRRDPRLEPWRQRWETIENLRAAARRRPVPSDDAAAQQETAEWEPVVPEGPSPAHVNGSPWYERLYGLPPVDPIPLALRTIIADEGDMISLLYPGVRIELPVLAVAFLQDHFLVVVTSKAVRLWDVGARRWFGDVPVTVEPGWDQAMFSASCRWLAIGRENGAVYLWGMNRAQTSGTLGPADMGPLRSMAFSSDDRYLATNSSSGSVQLWDVASGEPANLMGSGDAYAIAFSPDGSHLATGNADGTVQLWDVVTGSPAGGHIAADDQPLSSVLFSPDGRHLAVRNRTGRIRILWDAVSLPSHTATTGTGHSMSFSPDGRYLAASTEDGSLAWWDVAARSVLPAPTRLHPKQDHPSGPLVFSRDSSVLAAAHDQVICLYAWQPPLRRFLHSEEPPVRAPRAPARRPWAAPRLGLS